MNGTPWWGILLLLWGGLFSLVWIAVQWQAVRTFRQLTWSRDLPAPHLEDYPSLSVVVPACNEEDHLEEALQSILAQDYPDLRIVLVDDRSTDGTTEIMERIAARDRRVQVLRIDGLPTDWLGKVHALHRGQEAADGELLLFTDADVHFAPGFLRKTVAWMLERDLDHLAVGPEARTGQFWQEAMNNAFGGLFFLGLRVGELERPGGDAFVGIGAFNLVRRAALDRTAGFRWLRMEIIDDVGLGMMLKRAGARSGFLVGLGELWLDWYPSIGAMVHGLEKNMFGAICRFRYHRLLAVTVLSMLLLTGVPVALFQPFAIWPRVAGLVAVLVSLVSARSVHRLTGQRFWPLLLAPAGSLALVWILVRSGWMCFRRGGIEWRGTFYPVEKLKEGQRVRI